MKIYISGKITDNPNAEQQFETAEQWLLLNDYKPINPLKVGMPLRQAFTHDDYMSLSFELIRLSDVVYMLDGWQDSPGAKAELVYAKAIGKKVKFENKQWKFKQNNAVILGVDLAK